MGVEAFDVRTSRRVDRFLMRHPGGTPFHETRWLDLVRALFGFETRTLVAWEGNEVVGVLPLAMVTAPLTGRRLVSVPFGVYGGILASGSEVVEALDRAAQDLARLTGARFLETRYLGPAPTRHQALDRYETYRAELPADPDEVLARLPRKSRADVRKGRQRHGLVLVRGEELFDDFYRLYVLNKRRLGSPVFSAAYFRRLLDLYGPRATLHCVAVQGRPMAAVLSLRLGDTLYPYYSGSELEGRGLGAESTMYAGLMEEAVRDGCRLFDFGRSRVGSGPAAFKRHMGFEPTPLDYQYHFPRGGRPPQIHPSNPSMRLPRRILSSLPVWLARWVGPGILRHVP